MNIDEFTSTLPTIDHPSHPSHSQSRCGASDGELEELRQHGHRGEGEACGHGFLHHVGRRHGRETVVGTCWDHPELSSQKWGPKIWALEEKFLIEKWQFLSAGGFFKDV